MEYSLFLLVVVLLVRREVTAEAQSQALQRVTDEQNMDDLCLEKGIDRLGGNSSAELHSRFTSTKVKAMMMGKKFRLKLMKHLLHEEDEDTDPVFDSCRKNSFVCDSDDMYRSANGSCNNLLHPDWGQSFIPMRRSLPPQYDDGMALPRTKGKRDKTLPSARKISTELHTESEESTERNDVTYMAMQFAQFLDHDITSTPIQRGSEGATVMCCEEDIPPPIYNSAPDVTKRPQCFPITIPSGDRRFQRSCMNFVRSVQVTNADCNTVPAEQMNQITAYIDGSQVYGSSEEEQCDLRTFTGGLLKSTESKRELLPRNAVPDCTTSTAPNFCFKAGDERVNEQMALTSMHTIWLREHNRIATKLAKINRYWDDERLFQETRKIVGAMLQHITYTEFLPLVLSSVDLTEHNLLPTQNIHYSLLYNSSVDPSIRNSFGTAAYRFGHSMIRDHFSHSNKKFKSEEQLQLRTSFGNTSIIIESDGDAVNTLTRGLLSDPTESVDRHVTREISDFLFQDKDGNSFDLIALNIQRGRDHGLPGYNEWRKWCGLSKASNFKNKAKGLVDHSKEAADALKRLYRSPDDIDLFSGGVSETPVPGALLGPTFSCIVARQFQAIKIGDRFWYETGDSTVRFTQDQLAELHTASLARVICDNTDSNKVPPSVFTKISENNPLTRCSTIPKVKLQKWRDQEEGMWTEWLSWSPCQKGRRTRTRTCNRTGRKCPGSKKERESCDTNCTWSSWCEWGRCVTGCQYQIRTCPCKSCNGNKSLRWRSCGNRRTLGTPNCGSLYEYLRRYW